MQVLDLKNLAGKQRLEYISSASSKDWEKPMVTPSPESKDIFEIMHDRRSIRTFMDKPVTDEVLSMILEAGLRAPFAAQLCSIVYTRDQKKAKALGLGSYPTAQLFLIFFVDF